MARKAKAESIEIGITAADRKAIVDGLARVLADTYTLYLKTHSFHWNVTGPMFKSLHELFMTQYTELWTSVDEIAERIRSLGHFAPGNYKAFAVLTQIKDEEDVPEATKMLRQLLKGHETVARTCREAFPAAEKAGDQPTMDLLTTRMQAHEKTAWMLRSLLA
ncbi:MAG: DNA starvation/stationary phase protection protein [Alphaproteobacteria bacterium]|nr:DNA starvation/stationary phase protection protein [Alphaproteobacteria bacterium]